MEPTAFSDWRKLPPPELERQLNPRVTVPGFQEFLDRAAAASQRVRETFRVERNVRYGPRPRQCLDIYPAAAAGAPAVVFVHGGFWRSLSKEQSAGVAESLHPRGISTIVIGYDLCPSVTLDELVDEIAQALQWVLANASGYGMDSQRLHVAGSSAGAHLVAMATMKAVADRAWTPAFRSAWLSSGIYELEPVLSISVNREIRLDASAAERNSPARHPARLPMPLFIAAGGDESPAWIEQSVAFGEACVAAGNEVEVMIVPGAHHFSLGIGTAGTALNRALVAHVEAH